VTWNELKIHVDKKLTEAALDGTIEVNLIYIMDATEADQLNIRTDDQMLEIDE